MGAGRLKAEEAGSGAREPEGWDEAQGSLTRETEGGSATVTEMGNSEKGQLEKVTCPVGMSRLGRTLGFPGGGTQGAVRDWTWSCRQLSKLLAQDL